MINVILKNDFGSIEREVSITCYVWKIVREGISLLKFENPSKTLENGYLHVAFESICGRVFQNATCRTPMKRAVVIIYITSAIGLR